MTLTLILAANLISGVVAVWIAMALVVLGKRWFKRLVPHLVDFAIGTLLGSAFLGLLPGALANTSSEMQRSLLLTTLITILAFLALERLVAWRHCHVTGCPRHDSGAEHLATSVHVALLGDGLHNFVDGVAIAVAFMHSRAAGVMTSIAVLMHEVPQEIGDFGVFLRAGLSTRRALAYNTLGALSAIVGGVVGYFALNEASSIQPYVLAGSAASFIYLALADLVPSLHDASTDGRSTVVQLGLVSAGAGTVMLSHELMGHH